MQEVKLALTGFGNVGTGIVKILQGRSEDYERRYGVRLVLTGVADRGGASVNPAGLDLDALSSRKRETGTVAQADTEGLAGPEFLSAAQADVLLETASTNFDDAEPGWSYAREALRRDMDVVLASKGALTLYWKQLMGLARETGRILRYSATIGSPLPSLDVIDVSLAGVTTRAFQGLMNSTSNTILGLMSGGASYEDGVRRAQEIGIAETNPTLDVDGHDLAAKVTIVANTLFAASLELRQVEVEGIRGVSREDLTASRRNGQSIKLLGQASTNADGRVVASVRPTPLPADHPLGRLQGGDMGIVFQTDLYGDVVVTVENTDHQGALPTSMTVLRDVLFIARERRRETAA